MKVLEAEEARGFTYLCFEGEMTYCKDPPSSSQLRMYESRDSWLTGAQSCPKGRLCDSSGEGCRWPSESLQISLKKEIGGGW